jgi:hypothetical protein
MHGSISVRNDVAAHTARTWSRAIVSLLAALAIVAGLALAFVPYSRNLRGYLDGSPDNIQSDCGVPVAEALTGSSSRLLADEGVWFDGPPCQHSARYRAGLGGLLLVGGAYVLLRARGRRQTSA